MARLTSFEGLALAVFIAGCSASAQAPATKEPDASAPSPGPSAALLPPGYLPGYLARGATPDSLSLIPPPPGPKSPLQARDDAVAKNAVANIGGPRWKQAILDADLSFPNAAGTFSCALGAGVTEADTPRLYVLLRRTLVDIGLSTYPTKTKYMRHRPFTVDHGAICTPAARDALSHDGSYPSGHSAIGWGWALILAEAAPEREDAVLARGRAFGQSRLACNVHWQSDVEEGRVMASATVARLHDDPTFEADLQAAESEIASARNKGLAPTRDCAVEAARLAAG